MYHLTVMKSCSNIYFFVGFFSTRCWNVEKTNTFSKREEHSFFDVLRENEISTFSQSVCYKLTLCKYNPELFLTISTSYVSLRMPITMFLYIFVIFITLICYMFHSCIFRSIYQTIVLWRHIVINDFRRASPIKLLTMRRTHEVHLSDRNKRFHFKLCFRSTNWMFYLLLLSLWW